MNEDPQNWVAGVRFVDDLTPAESQAFWADPAFYMERWFKTATEKLVASGDFLTGTGAPCRTLPLN